MSYLDTPTILFAGQFQTDPPTANINARNYDNANFKPDYDQIEIGGYCPQGSGQFNLLNCRVQGVVYSDGSCADKPSDEPLVGMLISGAPDRVAAKIVDLDPMQRRVSQIFGLEIVLGTPGSNNGFRCRFAPAPFADIWQRNERKDDFGRSAYYQSVLTDLEPTENIDSKLLRELMDVGDSSSLSIRFTLDGYDLNPESPGFTIGRLVGAIGPVFPGEPRQFIAERLLRPTPESPLHFAPLQIRGRVASLDLSNSLPTDSPGGPPLDVGGIQLAILPKEKPPILLGDIPYRTTDWLKRTSGIARVELTPDQVRASETTPLGIVRVDSNQAGPILLQEHPQGAMLRSDQLAFRLNPDEEASATFYTREFGRPFPGAKIKVDFDNDFILDMAQGLPAGEPRTALEFSDVLESDGTGTAVATLTARDPGNPRGFIDGQVFALKYEWQGVEGAVYNAGVASGHLNALVWDAFEPPEVPTWLDHIQPILTQYANLYPAMKPIVDLSDFESVRAKRGLLTTAFKLPATDANHMPVTRDLSAPKREMILKWLDRPLYLYIENIEDLRRMLQTALLLEHATIPPYLTALYSIKQGSNQEVAEIIRSIVIEEMYHMALCCNLLNAIDGRPRLATSDFTLKYPSKLPLGLRPDLTVRLRRCSIEQIRDVFVSIEKPEESVNPAELHPLTIGWFYSQIEEALERLNKERDIFTGHSGRQLRQWPGPDKLVVVSDIESARAAIREIVEQGEGASPVDPDDEEGDPAHYYRFLEIVRGRRIVGSSFTGEPVPFDPDGVWPVNDDPDEEALPEDSRARVLSRQFNDAYGRMLNSLERVFNGRPDEIDCPVGIMHSMNLIARTLVQTSNGHPGGQTAGPSFQIEDAAS